jgi:diacylglycerol kinase
MTLNVAVVMDPIGAIKIAKDCAAGAVLVFSLCALGTFVVFLISHWPFWRR